MGWSESPIKKVANMSRCPKSAHEAYFIDFGRHENPFQGCCCSVLVVYLNMDLHLYIQYRPFNDVIWPL